jgi:hypothetical protein
MEMLFFDALLSVLSYLLYLNNKVYIIGAVNQTVHIILIFR